MSNSHSHVIKIIILGNSGTGKTSMIHRFIAEDVPTKHHPTIGIDFQVKTIKTSSGRYVRLHMWDTAGQEQFRAIVGAYYRCSAGGIILYDVNDLDTFKGVSYWLEMLRKNADGAIHTPIILIGNKIDLEESRQVSFDEANKYASEVGIRYAEISAKTGIGINEAMIRLVDDIEKYYIKGDRTCSGIKLGARLEYQDNTSQINHNKSKCC